MPVVVAITGPTGAGKSTIARRFCETTDSWATVEVDELKRFLVSDFLYDTSNEGLKQWRLLGENAGLIAENLLRAGYNLLVEGFLDAAGWQAVEERVTLNAKLLLDPMPEVAIARDSERDEDDRMGADAVRQHIRYFEHEPYFESFTRIASTNQDVDGTLRDLKAHLSGMNL